METMFRTPPKGTKYKTYGRRAREWTSPGTNRLGKSSRKINEALYEEMHTLIRMEMRIMRLQLEEEIREKVQAEMLAEVNTSKEEMYVNMKKQMQMQTPAELDRLKAEMQTTIDACMKEILELKDELNTYKKQEMHVQRETPPMPELKIEMEGLKKDMNTWADVVEGAKKKMESVMKENAPWIEVVKKNKGVPENKVNMINDTLEEEAKRKIRALRVRVVGWAEKGTPQEDAKTLSSKMGATEAPIMDAWRVGKEGDSRGKILVLKFADMDKKKAFLTHRKALKGEKIFLDEDLTPAQVAHRREHMPRILEARKEGKYAVYRDGRVIITERRSA